MSFEKGGFMTSNFCAVARSCSSFPVDDFFALARSCDLSDDQAEAIMAVIMLGMGASGDESEPVAAALAASRAMALLRIEQNMNDDSDAAESLDACRRMIMTLGIIWSMGGGLPEDLGQQACGVLVHTIFHRNGWANDENRARISKLNEKMLSLVPSSVGAPQ
ncbi:MAG: hypothetical protein N2688_11030 [Burkholderiaceae bacterium]|nr:hypothetical protein [Burkholderiaceae bacterium]